MVIRAFIPGTGFVVTVCCPAAPVSVAPPLRAPWPPPLPAAPPGAPGATPNADAVPGPSACARAVRWARTAYVTTPCVVVGFVPIASIVNGNVAPGMASNCATPVWLSFTFGRSVSLTVRSILTASGVFSTIAAPDVFDEEDDDDDPVAELDPPPPALSPIWTPSTATLPSN